MQIQLVQNRSLMLKMPRFPTYPDAVRSELQVSDIDKSIQILYDGDFVADKVQICQVDEMADVPDVPDSVETQIKRPRSSKRWRE